MGSLPDSRAGSGRPVSLRLVSWLAEPGARAAGPEWAQGPGWEGLGAPAAAGLGLDAALCSGPRWGRDGEGEGADPQERPERPRG